MGQKHARETEYQLDTRLDEATQKQKTDDIFPGEAKNNSFMPLSIWILSQKVTEQCPCLSKS